tara:strand:+ start:9128 stop:9820 length:693 start_codon:yes stop_codon:yes gene_type:complete
LQNEGLNRLYRVVQDYVPKSVLSIKNKAKSWGYGYDSKYDLIVISKDGTLGDVIEIQNLKIGLPLVSKNCIQRHKKKEQQYWERQELPKELSKIQSIFQWNEMSSEFKNRWVDYIENEFDNREEGIWVMSNGTPIYITGAHYMYLQWSTIDIGYPDFREANRLLFIFWEACKADNRSFGMVYLKIRRSGFSFMSSSECVNTATLARDARVGILSKTGGDAKKCLQIKLYL